jgi:hypothetical protein
MVQLKGALQHQAIRPLLSTPANLPISFAKTFKQLFNAFQHVFSNPSRTEDSTSSKKNFSCHIIY